MMKLNKSLYGLRPQASRMWHTRLTAGLVIWRFVQCLSEVRVFQLIGDDRVVIVIGLHVQDICV